MLGLASLACSGSSSGIPLERTKYLFAVARGVQRNYNISPSVSSTPDRFYSLSREACSGTCGYLSVARRGMFLFAVARGVQRNDTVLFTVEGFCSCFYSLSREACSGTREEQYMLKSALRVSIRCRERRAAERSRR